MKIRNRVILVIISTNFMIIVLSLLAGTGYVRESIEEYIEADMMVVADIADRFVSSELDMLRYEAVNAADSLAAADPADWDETLLEQAALYPRYIGFSVVKEGGGITASEGEHPASREAFENEVVSRAFSGETAISSTVPSEGGVVFYLAVPVLDDAADHILVLTLPGTYFSDMASEYHIWETGHIFIDDSEGYVIANIRPEWVEERQNFILDAQQNPQYEPIADVVGKLISGDRGIEYYSLDGVSRICAYRPISGSLEGWGLGIVAPMSESPVRGVDQSLFIIAVVCFVLNIVVAIIASNFVKKPFEEVAALREAAEAGSRAKTDFLAHMSHEMRTPLNAVVGLSELALDEGGLTSEAESKLEKIQSSGMTILSIVNDILDISKIESGKFEIYPTKYNTPSLINDLVTFNIVRIGDKPIEFKLIVDENLPSMLFGDDLRVKQIFNNLLSNAFKYTDAGTVEWHISFERDGTDIWIVSRIKDTGIGIKPENLEKLFTEYNQVYARTTRRIEGTGLGLAITRRLVDMMDGTITVESEYGKGTVFQIRIRQASVSGETSSIGKDVAENLMSQRYTLSKRTGNTKLLRADLSYAHVLVVDDIETNLDVVRGMLKPYGVKIDCAVSGPQAIEMIRAGQPRYNAVFMDHMMPGMDGIEAAEIIREDIGTDYARNIPIIALTANAIVGNEEMFLSCGFQDFISKPIDVSKLDSVLGKWVRDKSAEKERGDVTAEYPRARDEEHPAGLCSIDGVDTEKALENFNGDRAVLADVLRSYAVNTRLLLGELDGFLKENNLVEYAISVHGVKGSSYGIFADEIGAAAEALEKAAKAGDVSAVMAGHTAFEDKAGALLEAIDQWLCSADMARDKPVLGEPKPQLLAELREAVAAFEMDRIDRIMEKLESCRYERGGGIVVWLRTQINEMAFEKIINEEWPS